jgi:hypothetical protein
MGSTATRVPKRFSVATPLIPSSWELACATVWLDAIERYRGLLGRILFCGG